MSEPPPYANETAETLLNRIDECLGSKMRNMVMTQCYKMSSKQVKSLTTAPRQVSTFNKFCKERRPMIAEDRKNKKMPSLSLGETQKLLSEEWKKLTDEEKAKYK